MKKEFTVNEELTQVKISELRELALKVNMTSRGCVFTHDSGHCNLFEMSIRQSKKHYERLACADLRIPYDGIWHDLLECQYTTMKQILEDILQGVAPLWYTATVDFGVASTTESFCSSELRDDFIAEWQHKYPNAKITTDELIQGEE